MEYCVKPRKTIQKLMEGKPVTIVALGDSLTYGWMVSKGFLDFLQEMFTKSYPKSKVTLINRGIPGDTAYGGMRRLNKDVLSYDPDCIFIQFGLNDAFSGISPDEFKQTLHAIVEKIHVNSDGEIVMVTPVYLSNEKDNELTETFYRQIEELAVFHHLAVAQVHKSWEKSITEGVKIAGLVQSDLIHPTVEGYCLMAQAVMKLFL